LRRSGQKRSQIIRYFTQSLGFSLVLFFLTSYAILLAQAVTVKSLQIQLWPEFDRPETLVICQVELAATVTLPAQVSFYLPDHVETLHVVAYERNGNLVEAKAEDFTLTREGDQGLLTISSPSARFQFEYYDSKILSKEGQQRRLNLTFTPAHDVETALFQIQEPSQSQNFLLHPAPADRFTGNDGLQYQVINAGPLAAGAIFELAGEYQRGSDTLSRAALGADNAEHAADLAPVPIAETSNLVLGYTLIGVGLALLLAVGGWWLWTKPAAAPETLRPKPGREVVDSPIPAASGFCYRCGTALRPEANFCHTCGAERRKG
jgi:hypothetical protein